MWANVYTRGHVYSYVLSCLVFRILSFVVLSRSRSCTACSSSSVASPKEQYMQRYRRLRGGNCKIRAVLTIHTSETPIRTELRCYFRDVLKPRSEQQSTRCRRIELSCAAGVILTSYEVVERIKKADAKRLQRRLYSLPRPRNKGSHQQIHRSRTRLYTVKSVHRYTLMVR